MARCVRALTIALLIAGCGGARSEPRDPHAPFRAIQREEAVIARARATVASEAASCPERCRAPADACGASARICEIADPLGDADAASRCRSAQRTCAELRDAGSPPRCQCRI